MRKIFLFILILVTFSAYAQDRIAFDFNVGDIGFGGNFPLTNHYNAEFFLSLANIGIEDRFTNVGIGFSPFMMLSWSNNDNENTASFEATSLFNLRLHWNVLNINFSGVGNFYLGPFTSVNYFFIDNAVLWDRYIFTAGMHLGFRSNFGRFMYNLFSFEAGYRNINGDHRYYISGKVDILTLFLTIFLMSAASNY